MRHFINHCGLRNNVDEKTYKPDDPENFPSTPENLKEFFGTIPRRQESAIILKRWGHSISETPPSIEITRSHPVMVNGKLYNISDVCFDGSDTEKPFKVGGRLYAAHNEPLVLEFRGELPYL
jgi:hypothetical protein